MRKKVLLLLKELGIESTLSAGLSAGPSPSSTRRASPSRSPSSTRRASPSRSPSLKLDGDSRDSLKDIVDKINKYTDNTNPYKVLGLKESEDPNIDFRNNMKKIREASNRLKNMIWHCYENGNDCQSAYDKIDAAKRKLVDELEKKEESRITASSRNE